MKTIIFMQARGFDVKINSVATSINILELPYLTELLNLNKVKVHQISPFLYSNGRFDKTLLSLDKPWVGSSNQEVINIKEWLKC